MHSSALPGPCFKAINLRAGLNAVLCDEGGVADGETTVSAEAAFIWIFMLRRPAPFPGRPEHSIEKLLVQNGSSDNDVLSAGDHDGVVSAFEIYFRCLEARELASSNPRKIYAHARERDTFEARPTARRQSSLDRVGDRLSLGRVHEPEAPASRFGLESGQR